MVPCEELALSFFNSGRHHSPVEVAGIPHTVLR